MKTTLDKLKLLLEKAGIFDNINPPVSIKDIVEWENRNNAIIPEEINAFLQFSDGFEYGWGAIVIFPLKKIKIVKNWDSVPDGWLSLGSIIGDGAYLVSNENGDLFLADHENHDEPLRKFSLKEWLENRIFERIEEDYDIE